MTMHIYFLADKSGYEKGWSGFVERTLGKRFCEDGVAIPYQKHLDYLYDAEQAKAEAEALAAADKKAKELKAAAAAKKKTATSKKATSRSKAVK